MMKEIKIPTDEELNKKADTILGCDKAFDGFNSFLNKVSDQQLTIEFEDINYCFNIRIGSLFPYLNIHDMFTLGTKSAFCTEVLLYLMKHYLETGSFEKRIYINPGEPFQKKIFLLLNKCPPNILH